MVDWSQPKYSNKWYIMDKLMIVAIILLSMAFLSNTAWFLLMNHELSVMFSILMVISFIPILIALILMYKIRKGMWLKVIPDDDETIIPVIEKTLKQNKFPFTKLRTEGDIVIYFMKYSEIFDMNLYNIQIRVHKRGGAPGSGIEVGPSNPENEHQVENVKAILDSAFASIGT